MRPVPLAVLVLASSAAPLAFALGSAGCGGGTADVSADAGSSGADGTAGEAGDDGASQSTLKCFLSFGVSTSDSCDCTSDPLPTSMPIGPIEHCPSVDAPFMCVAFDQIGTSGSATKHECSCVPKCALQTSSASSSGLEPADLCHCGESTFLPTGGDGVAVHAKASCALKLCCKGGGACDCSDAPSFKCRTGMAEVAQCSSADFDEGLYMKNTYSNPVYGSPVRTDRCR